jgi:polyisoprenyl-phosphate glycosyltransferase
MNKFTAMLRFEGPPLSIPTPSRVSIQGPADSLPRTGDETTLWLLIPTYNDWDALFLTLRALDDDLQPHRLEANVLVVDDGSTVAPAPGPQTAWRSLKRVDLLSMRRNLGHQRAIAVGLCYLVDHAQGRGVLVMDGDGEDRPGDIPRLLEASATQSGQPAAFAARLKRSEGVTFTLLYHLYRLLHRLLTGVAVRMGNFSYLPWTHTKRLVICGELWNHYAAAVVHARIPYTLVPTERAKRLTGASSMNATSLVVHGLSAMAVFADRIGVRALAASALALSAAVLGLVTVLVIRWGTALALPGWATSAAGLLVVLVAVLVVVSTLFTFVVLAGRSQTTVVPLRDYKLFVGTVKPL